MLTGRLTCARLAVTWPRDVGRFRFLCVAIDRRPPDANNFTAANISISVEPQFLFGHGLLRARDLANLSRQSA
jgi:hypothetical protein